MSLERSPDSSVPSAGVDGPERPQVHVWPTVVRRALVVCAFVFLFFFSLAVGVRFGVRTTAGRAIAVKLVDGLPLGAVGRLHVEGLSGDLFGTFAFKRIAIIDTKGQWLEIDDAGVVWDPLELLGRRVHVNRLAAALVRLNRRPLLTPEPPRAPSRPSVSLVVDALQTRLETAPAFSVQRGVWSVAARFQTRLDRGVRADLNAQSLLHPGDGLKLVLRIGRKDHFLLRADAVEGKGGALAGALGLATTAPLQIQAMGDGTADAGYARLLAASGADRPLVAKVQWTKGGLIGEGRMALTASRLTKDLAGRLGSDVAIKISALHAKANTFELTAGLTAPNGAVTGKGLIDWRRRTTSGLTVEVKVTDLSKWLAAPKLGAGEISGVMAGGLDRFELKGTLRAARLEQSGYSLSRISGPVSLSLNDREWRAQGDVQGSGGAGSGLALTMLGPSPRVQFDASRLRDGHILVRSLDVDGVALKVSAKGGQGLLGRLSFKGTLQATNLAALRPGAHGGLALTWDAEEASGATAWDFGFGGDASAFASGLADLDHFLGPAPHLTATGSYGAAAGLVVKQAQLSGSALQVSGRGTISNEKAVAADLEWTAKGPLTAGPLLIAGAAKGTGKLSGTLAAPRADIAADLASLDLGSLVVSPTHVALTLVQTADGLAGAVQASGLTERFGTATAKAGFHLSGEDVSLSDISADGGGVKLSGSVGLTGGHVSAADLAMTAATGAFLASGRLSGTMQIQEGSTEPVAKLLLTGDRVTFPGQPIAFHSLNLRGDGPLKRLPFQIAADGAGPAPWGFAGRGQFSQAKTDLDFSLTGGGHFRQADFKLTEPTILRLSGSDETLHSALTIAGGQARIDFQTVKDALTARADLTNVSIAPFNQDFSGSLSGTLAVKGTGPHLGGTFNANLLGVRSRDAPASEGLTGKIKATLDDSRLHLDAAADNPEGLTSRASIDLPTEASSAPFRIAIDRTKALRGDFAADGEIRPLWDLFAGGERTLTGRLVTKGTISGSLNKPIAAGDGALRSGRFRDIATGLELQSLQFDTTFANDGLTVRQFSGADARGGSVSGEGRVSFAEDGASTFTLNLKKFQLLDNDLGRATASGAVTVTHPAKGQGKLIGRLTVDRADIIAATPTPTGVVPMDVVEINQVTPEGQEKPPARSLGPPISLDVAIQAQRGVYVKGKGLNVELSLDAHVGGTISQPDLTGSAKVVGGSYDFAGKRFDVANAGQIHLGSTPAQIRIDLSATWEDPTLTAVVRVQGSAAKPEITLTSTPVLPQDEILARVLFGVSASQLSGAQGAELASALASLAGGGGFDVIGNLRQFAGLDRLALGTTQASGTTISGGKYLSKDVYLELTGGARNGSGAQVEWTIRRNLSIVSRFGAAQDPRYANDTDASLSIRFRTDF